MSKIIQAINSMITNEDEISGVIEGDTSANEYIFVFGKKYLWSINANKEPGEPDEYFLHYYPDSPDPTWLAELDPRDWATQVNKVSYRSSDFPGKEAIESFRELYSTVQEKAYGMDTVLDDIINHIPF